MPARLRIHNQVCGPDYVIRSHLRHGGERVLSGLGIAPFRCQRCGVRYFKPVSPLSALMWLGTIVLVLGWGTMWLVTVPAAQRPIRAEAGPSAGQECSSLTLPAPPCPLSSRHPLNGEESPVPPAGG